MAVSLIYIDSRIIRGGICTGWAAKYPCDGLIAVNNAASKNSVLKAVYKNASGKETFVWSIEEFSKNAEKVLKSKEAYFLITKNLMDMKKLLVDQKFQPEVHTVIIGPRGGKTEPEKEETGYPFTQEETKAMEEIRNAGYEIKLLSVKNNYFL